MRVLSGRWLARFAAVIIVATVWALAAPGTPSAEAQSCLADMTANDETDLAFAIGCFNTGALPNTVSTITLTQDIVLSTPLPGINKSSTAILELSGAGFALDANAVVDDALLILNGIVQIDDLTVTGATDDGIEINDGLVTITGSTITANDYGINAFPAGAVTLRNSTVFGNATWGVRVDAGAVIESSTIVDNGGVGIEDSAVATVTDSLVANNSGDDCEALLGSDGGGNLFGDTTCSGLKSLDLRASLGAGPALNGCTTPCTKTLALLPGSPAVDAAGTCNVSTDQRTHPRTAGSCDAGAYELGDCLAAFSVMDETELAFAIGCYNNAIANSVTRITWTQDIVLTLALPVFDNGIAKAQLNGGGFTLDGGGNVQDVLSMNDGDLTIVDVTITGAMDDGFQALAGSLAIIRSTLTSNNFGVNAVTPATVVLSNSTVHDNTNWGVRVSTGAVVQSSTIVDNGAEGIKPGALAVVADSLVANNAGGDCDGSVGTDDGGNLFGDATCNGTATVGLRATLAADLALNGCTAPCTKTLALLPGSPAVDAAGTCNVSNDQRTHPRTAGSCDAGAYELGDCSAAFSVMDETELAFAAGCYNNAAAATTTTVSLTADITLAMAPIFIDNNTTAILNVLGGGRTIDAGGGPEAFSVDNGNLLVSDVTLTGATEMFGGAAIAVFDGSLVAEQTTFSGNNLAFFAASGTTVTVRNSTLSNNTIGGVLSEGQVEIFSSTIVDNGDGIDSSGVGATVTVTDSLVARNTADCTGPVLGDGNVFGDVSCDGTATPGLAASLAADLAPNGCTAPCTKTLALLPGSAAVDAAGACTVVLDQRAMNRTAGSCDAGAFELGDCATSAMVSTETELAVAIGCFNTGAVPNTVTTITLTQDIVLSTLLPGIDSSSTAILELDGAGFTLDGDSAVVDVLLVMDGIVEIDDLTVTGATDDGIEINDGFVTIDGSTFTANEYGINASPAGAVTLRNSTVFGNVEWGAFIQVGAIIESSTIVDNGGAGIDFAALATVTDSLVANNGDGDCEVILGSDGGGNVFSDATCNGSAEAGLRATLAADLALNGCTAPCTKTLALLSGSPAVDAAGACGVSVDQRGFARTAGRCDAGAFEFGDLLCNGTPVTISAVAGVVTTGTSGNDVILGTAGPDTINSLGGDDLICALAGDDVVDAGDGNDTVFADAGLDTVVGGNGNDTLWGGPDRDIMRGGPDVDVLHGEGGDDRLLGGIGGDTINGGDGDDYLGGFGGGDTINGGPGNETIFGGFGADIIDGGPGNDEIFGLIGNDTIKGGTGDDKLNGDRGNDTIEGGPGNDIIRGGNANDVLRGDAGDDSVSGGKADDTLSGGDDIDVCVGNLQNVADTADATCETIFGVP